MHEFLTLLAAWFLHLDVHLAELVAGNVGTGRGAGFLASDEDRLASLQGALKCGTNCGSCVPELKRRVRSARPAAAGHAADRVIIPIQQVA